LLTDSIYANKINIYKLFKKYNKKNNGKMDADEFAVLMKKIDKEILPE
jgi:hypothetical protein